MPYRRTRPLLTTPENPQLNWGDSINNGLVAYYPLNEPGGLKARCAVNPAQNLTLIGYTSRLNGPGGGHGRALRFTGVGQYAQGTLVKAITGGPATISAWVTLDALTVSSPYIAELGTGGTQNTGYSIFFSGSNPGFTLQAFSCVGTFSVAVGQRVFVVGSLDSAMLQSIYANGILLNTVQRSSFPNVSSKVTIGGINSPAINYNVLGSIDNVRFYNRAL